VGRVISGVCDFVCLPVCPRSKRKIARAINATLGRHAVHGGPAAGIDPEVERSKVKVTCMFIIGIVWMWIILPATESAMVMTSQQVPETELSDCCGHEDWRPPQFNVK